MKHLNEPLFFDDLEAWGFGAVNPNVYYYFCGHGANPITIKFDEKEYKSVLELNDKFKDVVDFIVEEKSRKPSWDLIKDIHKENGAWAYTFKKGKGYRNVIDFEKYFKDKKTKNMLDNL